MENNQKIYDVLVIGGGPGGMFAGHLAHSRQLSSLIVEAAKDLGGQPLMLYAQKSTYDIPGMTDPLGVELVEMYEKQVRAGSTEIKTGVKLEKYEVENGLFKIYLSDQTTAYGRYLIVSIGNGIMKQIELTIPGAEKHEHIDYVVGNLEKYRNKKVIVLGGGDSAVDWANQISKSPRIAKEVSMVHWKPELTTCGTKCEDLDKNHVTKYLNWTSQRVEGQKLVIKHNETNEEKTLDFDYMIVQFGQKIDLSNNIIFKEVAKNKLNRMLVNTKYETNIENLYAIGNACFYEGKKLTILGAQAEALTAISAIVDKEKVRKAKA